MTLLILIGLLAVWTGNESVSGVTSSRFVLGPSDDAGEMGVAGCTAAGTVSDEWLGRGIWPFFFEAEPAAGGFDGRVGGSGTFVFRHGKRDGKLVDKLDNNVVTCDMM